MVAAPARCSLEYDLVNAPTARAPGGDGARGARSRHSGLAGTAGGVGPCTVTVDRGSVACAYVVRGCPPRTGRGRTHALGLARPCTRYMVLRLDVRDRVLYV